jgi:hypothetical protein
MGYIFSLEMVTQCLKFVGGIDINFWHPNFGLVYICIFSVTYHLY